MSPSLDDAVDSFLRGDHDRPFAADVPGPHPGLGPGEIVDVALRSLRSLNSPEPYHGAAVLLRFCAPLSRSERWGGGGVGGGGGSGPGGGSGLDPLKEVLRGSFTPVMLARRLRASLPLAGLLDWDTLDVTEGLAVPDQTRERLGAGTTVAFVSAALFFGDGVEPSIIQFGLRRIGGVWLLDTAVVSQKEWFTSESSD